MRFALGNWLHDGIVWYSSKDDVLRHSLRQLWVTSACVADLWRHCETPTGVTLVTWQSVTCQLVVWVKTFFMQNFPPPDKKDCLYFHRHFIIQAVQTLTFSKTPESVLKFRLFWCYHISPKRDFAEWEFAERKFTEVPLKKQMRKFTEVKNFPKFHRITEVNQMML